MFKLNTRYLIGLITISLIIYYFISYSRNPESQAYPMALIGLSLGNVITNFIIVFILFLFFKLIERIANKAVYNQNNNLGFFICWGLTTAVNVFSQLQLIPEKVDSKKIGIEACITKFRKTNGNKYDTIFDVAKYCDCAVSKLIEQDGFSSIEMLDELKNTNSVTYNEIILPCQQDALIVVSNTSVFGLIDSDTLPVINTENYSKVKIKVGTKEYYYIIDSGATDLFISNTLLQDYKENLPENEIQEISDREYQMADGTIKTLKRVKISKVFLGQFTLPDVIFAIAPDSNLPLLGKGILGRFKSWSISDKHHLILVK